MIPNDFWNQKFFTSFRFWGIPETPKIFFQNFEISKCSTGRNSQYFLTKPGLIERKNDFAHTYEETCGNFAQGVPQDPENSKVAQFSGKNSKNTLRGRNHQKSLHTYVRNQFIFLLSLVPSKNIENCDLRNILNKLVFEKNIFSSFGNSPKTKKGRQFLISEIVRNHSHGHFKPSYG